MHQYLNLDNEYNELEILARNKLAKKINKQGHAFSFMNSLKKDIKLSKNKERGSKYIGVSKNGSCW